MHLGSTSDLMWFGAALKGGPQILTTVPAPLTTTVSIEKSSF